MDRRAVERQALRENELANALGRASGYYSRNRRALIYGLSALLALVVVMGGYLAWRQNVETKSRALLAEAMVTAEARVVAPTPPAEGATAPAPQPNTYPTERAKLEAALTKLMAAADAYPNTDAGRTARFQAAATLVQLSRFDEAVAQYDRVISDGSGLISRTARLGKAEAQLRAGRHDEAIATFKQLSEGTQAGLPPEALLMELARAYRLAGRTEDARKTLTQIVEQHASSPLAAEAKTELERLEG